MFQRLLYRILFISWYLLSLLPFWILYYISDILYFPLFYLVRYRRKVVEKSLSECFPDKSPSERLKIEKQFYHFFCDYVLETIKLFSISRKSMMKRMEFCGTEELMADLKQKNKKLCFVYLGHYCNWEYVASLQYWLPDAHCGQIYHRIYNKEFDELFLKLRGQFGGESILMSNTLRRILTLRKEAQPSVIGFIADQLPKWENMGHWTHFLNHETSFFTGAERIGKQIDAAFYFLQVERVKRGHYKATFRKITSDPKEHPDFDITDIYARMLEEQIRKAPQFWLWTHKRWKRTKEEWLKKQNKGEHEN